MDLVQSQLRIAAGESLAEMGLTQDKIATKGFAIQCRLTTEDPLNDFAPDTGKTEERHPGGETRGLMRERGESRCAGSV